MTDEEIEVRRERLSAQKRAFLEKIKQKNSVEQEAGPRIPARTQPASSVVLSFAQQRLWFMHQLDPQAANYHLPVSVRLRGPLQIDILERCLTEITQRHEILRTTFSLEEDQPRQHIHPGGSVELRQIDLSVLPEERRENEARIRIREFFQQPFDLERGPLWRTCVLFLGREDYILATCLNHMIADGWSIEVLLTGESNCRMPRHCSHYRQIIRDHSSRARRAQVARRSFLSGSSRISGG